MIPYIICIMSGIPTHSTLARAFIVIHKKKKSVGAISYLKCVDNKASCDNIVLTSNMNIHASKVAKCKSENKQTTTTTTSGEEH